MLGRRGRTTPSQSRGTEDAPAWVEALESRTLLSSASLGIAPGQGVESASSGDSMARAAARTAHDGDAADDRLEGEDEGSSSKGSPANRTAWLTMPPRRAVLPGEDPADRAMNAWLRAGTESGSTAAKSEPPAPAAVGAAPGMHLGLAAAESAPAEWIAGLRSQLESGRASDRQARSAIDDETPVNAAMQSGQSERGGVVARFASVDAAGTFGDALARFMDECAGLSPGLAVGRIRPNHTRAWVATVAMTILDLGIGYHLIRRARRKRLAIESG